jgi:flagellar motility protein MotE (MotC chaperone)
VGQDVAAAKTHLESQHIEVNEVKKYEPKLNKSSLSDMNRRPVNLKAGQKVDIYEENGKVRYYALAKETRDTAEPARDQADEVIKLREELKKTKRDAADKDEKINKLQVEMETLRKEQSEIKALLNSDAMIKMMKTINKTREP